VPGAGAWRVLPILAAALLGLVAAAVCGVLGWWQWERAQTQGQVVLPGPAVPISEVTVPGEATTGIGRLVFAEGQWADAPAAYVGGRQVDGVDAVLLVLPLHVDADATGTGEAATLAVLAGWLPEADAPQPVPGTQTASVTGVLRSSEAIGTVAQPLGPDGPVFLESLSTAALAQVWPSPVYTPVLAADVPAPGWNALPPPPVERKLDVRSVTYAGEWWLFGGFALFLAVRWIRDNGRVATTIEDLREQL
jgi:cytochrome oxidase assembly protein ShyY1